MSSGSEYEARTIYYGLEEPVPIMLLDPKEWMAIFGGLGLGIVMQSFILMVILPYVVFKGYRKLKGYGKRGAVFHRLWRFGIPADPLMRYGVPKPTAVQFHE